MRINPINNVNNVYKANKTSKAYGATNVSSSKDTLALSDFAKDLQIAKGAVTNAPDIRQAKVDDIRQQMEAGTYNVSASMLADKLLKQQTE